jgi:hypothetical protein|tara:strand:- start:247 stop:591 length:345 start_codon:yes stop_codon:yes gene_type:complete
MREALDKEKIDGDRIYFVDSISAIIKRTKNIKGCEYVSTPYDLKQTGNSIKKAIQNDYTFVVFDSLSSLIVYGQAIPAGANILIDFINSFRSDLEAKNGDAIFICKKKDQKKKV